MAKKKATKKKESKGKKEEVCEIFEISKKGGKDKEVIACGIVDKKAVTKDQVKHQNNILKGFWITIGIVIILIFGAIYFINSVGNFTYRGVEGKIISEGKLIFYEIEFPYIKDGNLISYFVYIRNDPRKLDKEVPFNGEMDFGDLFNVDNRHRLIIDAEEEFHCEGDGIIALVNMNNLEALKIRKSITTENSSLGCDAEGRYMFLNIAVGDKTEINQIGDSCYEITINDCEILKGTERFMTEAFVYYYDHLEQ